jgi:type IV pilus assembly protein PilY1
VDVGELWAFIPPGQRDNLPRISDGNHDYYVDGSPTITYGDLITGTQLFQPELMIFGERRGGSSYYVLNISDPYKPIWKYQIESNIISGEETLGQSWSTPRVCNIATGTEKVNGRDIPTYEKFFMMAGGYDTNQDLDTPAVPDSAGKAIYSVRTSDGAITIDGKPAGFRVTDNTAGLTTLMRNCIVDVNPTSTYTLGYGKDITTRVYAGDLGGKVFTFADDRKIEQEDGEYVVKSKVPDGTFPIKNCLFITQGTKKIFYAPATSRISNSYTEWVVFGTGDRENPLNTSTVNRIYAVKNNWLDTNLSESNLIDLTQNLIVEGSDDDKKNTYRDLRTSKGWYVTFYDPGEKMISPPIIINGYIFFTTYVPRPGTLNTDRCEGGEVGTTFLWSIDLETGIPAYDANKDTVKTMPERRIQVAVMAQPQASGDSTIFTPAMFTVPSRINFDYFFWRQR